MLTHTQLFCSTPHVPAAAKGSHHSCHAKNAMMTFTYDAMQITYNLAPQISFPESFIYYNYIHTFSLVAIGAAMLRTLLRYAHAHVKSARPLIFLDTFTAPRLPKIEYFDKDNRDSQYWAVKWSVGPLVGVNFDKDDSDDDDNDQNNNADSELQEHDVMCGICGRTFFDKSTKTRHENACQKKLKKERAKRKRELTEDQGARVQCEICLQTFRDNSSLGAHRYTYFLCHSWPISSNIHYQGNLLRAIILLHTELLSIKFSPSLFLSRILHL